MKTRTKSPHRITVIYAWSIGITIMVIAGLVIWGIRAMIPLPMLIIFIVLMPVLLSFFFGELICTLSRRIRDLEIEVNHLKQRRHNSGEKHAGPPPAENDK